jgi:hypothetical protein
MPHQSTASAPEAVNHVPQPYSLLPGAVLHEFRRFEDFEGAGGAALALEEVDGRCFEAFHVLSVARDEVLHNDGSADRIAALIRAAQALLGHASPALMAAQTYAEERKAAQRLAEAG